MITANRLSELNGNGKTKSRKSSKKRSTPPTNDRSTWWWATGGVVFMATLSALLNGYANAQHATAPLAGWGMGLSVPVIVLILGRVAGNKWRKSQRRIAYLTGGSGVALLFLSVYHCAMSIAALTGSPLLLALPMAVAIDCGLVMCEISAITEE